MFNRAVAALFKPGEFAASLFANKAEDPTGTIIQLDKVINPQALPQFWTLAIPGWYDPSMGDLDIRAEQHCRKLNQVISGRIAPDGSIIEGEAVDVYLKNHPFLVFEVDYLLCGEKSEITPAIKKLQREAMAYAFQASGFPFACLVDSGGKSIHAYVRLEDDLGSIAQFRESVEYQRLQDLAWVVFGHYDQKVMKEAGRVRLVRTPGALREDGSPQTIIAVGQRVTIQGLLAWFQSQLSPEASAEVWGRQPVVAGDSPLRHRYLRLHKWRGDLLKDHNPGERGTNWMFVSKSLTVAGCIQPKMLARPSAQLPCGHWHASWLWHVSAYVFNQCSKGWFFSHSGGDWANTSERLRWWESTDRKQHLTEQITFETKGKAQDSLSLVASWQENAAKSVVEDLPLPPAAGPSVHIGGVTGASLQVDPNAPPPQIGAKKKEKKEGDPTPYKKYIDKLYAAFPKTNLIKVSKHFGGDWYVFNGKIWEITSEDTIVKLMTSLVFGTGALQKVINEGVKTLATDVLEHKEWVEYDRAIAFNNGTLYIDHGNVEFKPRHDPADKLRCMIPFNYDPQAVCPQWERFAKWALPDSSRLSVLQEAFGYTLVPGQPYQAFFLFTGVGSNGKSVVLSLLRQIHQESYESVPLASLGERFSMGTAYCKRLAIDTEAESAGAGKNASDMALAQNTLKAWTGGDPVKIEAKTIQGWSSKVSAKYFLSANRRPKFMDPSKGVWRRLKLLKFESAIDEKNEIRDLDKILAQEMSGIINWAITGLLRLYAQNGFTTSPVLTADIHEYQNDTDSAFQFFNMFFRSDPNAGWHDIRPVYQAYKSYCAETGCFPVNEAEFRMRMTMKGVSIGQPEEHEVVYGAPFGQTRIPGKQYWAIKNFRCLHPTYLTAQVVGLHPAGAVAPQTMPQGVAR